MNIKNIAYYLRKKKRIIADYFNYGVFDIIAIVIPIIIIPLLVDVFGRTGFGEIVLARAYSGVAGVFIDFGYKNSGSKNIAGKNNNVLFLNTSLTIKFLIFILGGFIYGLLCFKFSNNPLFYFAFYLLNLQSILIPNFLYVGIGEFKILTKIGFIVSLIQILLFFILIKKYELLILVPLIYLISYIIGGVYSYFQLKKINKNYFKFIKIKKAFVPWNENLVFVKKNSLGIIKDRLSYFIIGYFIGKASLLEFDIGMKLVNLLSRPISIFSNIIIRKSMELSANKNFFFKQLKYVIFFSFTIWCLSSLILPFVIEFILHEPIDISILIILSVSSIFLNITSFINSNGLLVFNKSKDIFRGMLLATMTFLLLLLILFQFEIIKPIYVIIIATVSTYLLESLYALSQIKK